MARRAPAARPPEHEQPVDDEQPVDERPAGEDQVDDEDAPRARSDGRARAAAGQALSVANDGAGFVLGLLLWGWIILPFLKGGSGQVKQVLKAKFLNQAADGSWLP